MLDFSKLLCQCLMCCGFVLQLITSTAHAENFGIHNIQIFSSAQHSIVKDSKHYPPNFIIKHNVRLPHEAYPIPSASAWYTFNFNLTEQPQHNLNLYLPLINMNASIYLNHQLIGASGSFKEPMSRFWHTPVLFYLPIPNLVQGSNTIHIRLKSSPPNDLTQLGKIYLGSADLIYALYAKEYFASYTIHLMALSAAIFLSFIVFYLWFLRQQDEYLYFALCASTWAVSTLNLVIHNPPLSTPVWEWLIHSNLSWMPIFIMLFVRRLVHKGINTFGKITWFVSIILTIVLFFVPYYYFFPIANTWHLFTLFIAIYTVYLVISHYFIYRDKTLRTLSIGFFVVASFGIHDYLIIVGILNSENRFLLDYSMPLLLIAIAVVLINRFVKTSIDLEQANTTLAQRIQSTEIEIKKNYAIISTMETVKAVNQERTRIFNDLHDDLGAKLLSLVYKSETDEQKHLAKQAMEGLREIVKRSPIAATGDLNPLAMWFTECQKRCAEHQVHLTWQQHKIPKHFLPPLPLTNVLREAISNAIKHGDSKRICVRLFIRHNLFIMSVCNTGAPFSEHTQQGSGRKNMRSRIENLGGKIRWRSGRLGGCHVIWITAMKNHYAV